MVILGVMIGLMLTALVAAAETRVRIEGMRHASEGEQTGIT